MRQIHQNHRKFFERFAAGVTAYRQQLSLAQSGAVHIGAMDGGQALYLRPQHFDTHLFIQASTGAGKSFLARTLFRALAQLPGKRTIVVNDPKYDLFSMLAEDCAALGFDKRTLLFDTSRTNHILSFNPLKKNGLSVPDHSMWTLGGIRSAWGQETFNTTPQMLRWLYDAIALTIENDGNFADALQLLHYEETVTRKAFVARTEDRLLEQEWRGYEALARSRRREETASAYARLRPFCVNPTIHRIVNNRERSLDLADVLRRGQILLTTFPRYRPLEPELTDLLRALLLQSLLAQAFHIPLAERGPLYIILDEAEHALAKDTGVIETVLNEGRSLGIHLILIFHTLAQVSRSNPNLLASVLTNCRTKIVGGGLTQEDLAILAGEFFTEEWHPHIIKDEEYGLELEPIETTRDHVAVSNGDQRTVGVNLGAALGKALTQGVSESRSLGFGESNAESHTYGRHSAHTATNSEGVHYGDVLSESAGTVIGPDGMPQSVHSGAAHAITSGNVSSHGRANTEGESETWGNTKTISQQVSQGIAQSLLRSVSATLSEGVSLSNGTSWQQSVTRVPFHEYVKRLTHKWREFFSLEEFLTVHVIKLKQQGKAHFAIKPPEGHAAFFRALFVTSLLPNGQAGDERINAFERKVFAQPCYGLLGEIEHQFERQVTIETDTLDPQSQEPTDEDFYET